MDFSRSNTHCLGTTPWIEQFNEATSFLDGSQIYGSTIEGQKILRKGQDGLLATHSTLNEFLPSRKDLGLGKFFDKTQCGVRPCNFDTMAFSRDLQYGTCTNLLSYKPFFCYYMYRRPAFLSKKPFNKSKM